MPIKTQQKNEIWACVLLAGALFLAVGLFTYDAGDTFLRSSPPNDPTVNRAGVIGAYLTEVLVLFFGRSAFLFPGILLVWALSRFLGLSPPRLGLKLFGFFVLLLSTATWFGIGNTNAAQVLADGGVAGFFISGLMQPYFGLAGSRVVVAALLALSLLLATEFLFVPFLIRVAKIVMNGLAHMREADLPVAVKAVKRPRPKIVRFDAARKQKTAPEAVSASKVQPKPKTGPPPKTPKLPTGPKPAFKPAAKIRLALPKKPQAVQKSAKPAPKGNYTIPSLDILAAAPAQDGQLSDDLERNSRTLEGVLLDFGIEARVVQVNQGPVITRYELLPAPGVKVGRITSLSDDIALAMKAQSIRIVAPIPGKAAVGIEIPNAQSALVYLQEILRSEAFSKIDSKLAIALGKDISGNALVADLAAMPHLLIAGTTGSGKTVCVNSIIAGILFNATPDDVKFLMVDPKMVELTAYNKLPHLICPVVTNAKRVSAALEWVVGEMENRYKRLAEAGVRDIKSFNKKEKDNKLPYIVVVIDELADLMAVAQDKIEGAITRLAQLARAVGIHMVLATQRPSVDVITGVIKANFPSRISFKVASKVDSRTVLDGSGADKLIGKGDFLFIKPGHEKPIRGQATLVGDSEIDRLIEVWNAQGQAGHDDALVSKLEKKEGVRDGQRDDLFDEAVRVILQTGQASTSMLQRRLRLGYTRAARIVDEIEQAGIVGPSRGAKPREILISEYTGSSTPAGKEAQPQTQKSPVDDREVLSAEGEA